MIAIFFYVGIEIGIPGELNAWISRENFEGAAAVAGSLAALYWLMMLIGRFLSSIISGKVSARAQMITVSSVAIVLILVAIFLPKEITFKSPEISALNITSGEVPMKCLFLFLCGGIMPFIQDWIGRNFGYITSYWLVVAMLVYILYYSLIGSKNVNTDIPVSEEPFDLRDL